MIAAAYADRPAEGEVVQRHGLAVEGWVLVQARPLLSEIVVEAEGVVVGSTRQLFARPDVSAAYGMAATARSGFAVHCRIPEALRGNAGAHLVVKAVFVDGSVEEIARRNVRFSGFDYRVSAHGYVLADTWDNVVRRDQIYASGPPSPLADPQCVELIARYLEPGARVLDVGCGIGAYGRPLAERGLRWTGCEVRADFVEQATDAGLDVRLVGDDGRLPFKDAEFDAVIAVEVLEHVENFAELVTELRRVAPRALVSVPNFETIPVTASFYALPWHMLEPDHKNFFSHASLSATLRRRFNHVEVLEYGPLPLLRSQDGLPVYNHLFAIAAAD